MVKTICISVPVLAMLIVVWKYRSVEDLHFPGKMCLVNSKVTSTNLHSDMSSSEDSVGWEVMWRRLSLLRERCGDLCDTGKTVIKESFKKKNHCNHITKWLN